MPDIDELKQIGIIFGRNLEKDNIITRYYSDCYKYDHTENEWIEEDQNEDYDKSTTESVTKTVKLGYNPTHYVSKSQKVKKSKSQKVKKSKSQKVKKSKSQNDDDNIIEYQSLFDPIFFWN